MRQSIDRRTFIKSAAFTAATVASVGAKRWGLATSHGPFGPLKDDLLIKLPEGFSYKVIAETGMPLTGGRGPVGRPPFPDLNVVFPQPDGKLLLCTSHEIPEEVPGAWPTPKEEYDPQAAGAITSLLLNPDLSVAESAYTTGGMLTNCSGSGTPWGTVLTGEESVKTVGKPHGFIWEVNPNTHTKVRLDACGKFEHETAVVDPVTGYVYLTEDSGTGLFYRMRPNSPGQLGTGVLEALSTSGGWVVIDDPLATGGSTVSQGVAKGARTFRRLEGGRIDPFSRYFYFAETGDATTGGKIWRINLDTSVLELYASGGTGATMNMPDNVEFDAAGNLFVTEDRSNAALNVPNRVLFIDRATGQVSIFAELVQKFSSPGSVNIADEPTGPAFSPDGTVLFLNLQREFFGITVAITGPFSQGPPPVASAALPVGAESEELSSLLAVGPMKGIGSMPLAAAAGLIALRRRGEDAPIPEDLAQFADELGEPSADYKPKRR